MSGAMGTVRAWKNEIAPRWLFQVQLNKKIMKKYAFYGMFNSLKQNKPKGRAYFFTYDYTTYQKPLTNEFHKEQSASSF